MAEMQSPTACDGRARETVLAGALDGSHPTKSPIEIQQVARLRRLFALTAATAETIAALAWGLAR